MRWIPAVLVCAALLAAACGSDSDVDPVTAAQTRVSRAQDDVEQAQSDYHEARADFCDEAKSYIVAVDRYGKVFDDGEATVGDVTTAGADLEAPRKSVKDSATSVQDAGDALAKAQQELAATKVALVEAQSGTSTTGPTASSTTTEPVVAVGTLDGVQQAESFLAKASEGITEQTPLTEATAQYNSAAFALEVAWLKLFDEAGCLTEGQQQKAVTSLTEYTSSLQRSLTTAGYYDGPIDGLYGATTAAAVEALQTANGLPATGYLDRATAAALEDAVEAKGGEVGTQAVAHTSAVQSTLKLAGYWDGPVDGTWTPELTTALKQFQTDLGVPASGAVDTATLAALEQAISEAESSSSTSTTTGSSSSTTSSTTSTTAP